MENIIIKLNEKKRIALVAHDNKKQDLLEWAKWNKTLLIEHDLFATGTTGNLLEEVLGTTDSLLYRRGNYVEAELLYRRALAIREKSLGQNHPEVAVSLNDLAVTLQRQGRYAEAELLHRRAMAIHTHRGGM